MSLILAIDTSARHFSLALLRDETTIADYDSRKIRAESASNDIPGFSEQTTANSVAPGISVTLFPAMNSLLEAGQTELSELDLISVAIGPGSFTGLRVGVVMAKTLAYVTDVPIVGVNTLEVIAAQAFAACPESHLRTVKPILNAQRQQLFGGAFQYVSRWQVQRVETDRLYDRQTWLESLKPNEIVTGSGLAPLVPNLTQSRLSLENNIVIAPEPGWQCSAQSVGHYGRSRFLSGQRDSFWGLEPIYFRPSTAEEVATNKKRSNVR